MPSSSDHHGAGSTKSSDDNGTQSSGDHNKKKHRSRSRDDLGHSRHKSRERSRHRSRSRDDLGHSRHKSRERSLHSGSEGKQGSFGSLSSLSSIESSRSKSRNDRSLKSRSKGLQRNQLSARSLDGLVQNIASIHENSHHSHKGKADRSKDSLGQSSHSRKGRSVRSMDALGTSNHSRKGGRHRSKESLHGSSGDHSIKSSGGSRSRHRSNEELSASSGLDVSVESRTRRIAKEDLDLNRAKEDEEAKKRGRRAGRSKSPAPGPHTVGYKGRARPLDKDSKKSPSRARATKPGVENVLSPRDKGSEKAKRSERVGVKTVSSVRDKGSEKAKREKARAGKKAGIFAGVGDRGLEKAKREKASAGKKAGFIARVGDRGLQKAKRAANARSTPNENLSIDPEWSIDPAPSPASNDLPLAAVAVDDTANEEVFEQRVQEAVGRMMKNTQRGETTDDASGVPENSRFRTRDRMFIFVVIVLIAIIGGGLGFFFLWRKNMDAEPSQSSSEPDPLLRYKPPSEEECQAIREQKPVPGQDDMVVVRMIFEIEVVFSQEDDFNAYFAGLVTAVQEMLVPELAGCTQPNRQAVEAAAHPYPIANGNVSAEKKIGESCSGIRESQSPSIAPTTSLEPTLTTSPTNFEGDRYFVRRPTAFVTSSPIGISKPCRRGALNLELFIRNDADASGILPMIEDVFELDGGQSLVDKLELSDDGYQEIKFVGGSDMDPLNESTSTPTAVGSGFLNEPTRTSNSPTIAQMLEVSKEPSLKPSVQPSLAPSTSATPLPTQAATTDTPSPTQAATMNAAPSTTPSVDLSVSPSTEPSSPSFPPSEMTTASPTPLPSPGPTQPPTQDPTSFPTPSPSPGSTPVDSAKPTTSPSPSSSPSTSPTQNVGLGCPGSSTRAFIPTSAGLQADGWQLVAWAQGIGGMFNGNTDLDPTASYGTAPTDLVNISPDQPDFQIAYQDLLSPDGNEILFITGDHTRWGYMEFESAFPLQAVFPFTVFEPHTEFTMCAGDNTGINLNCGSILYRPDYPLEDPWISIANGGHFEGYDQDLMVWGENYFGNTGSNLKNAHGGMKVLVRPRKAPLAVDRTNFSGTCAQHVGLGCPGSSTRAFIPTSAGLQADGWQLIAWAQGIGGMFNGNTDLDPTASFGTAPTDLVEISPDQPDFQIAYQDLLSPDGNEILFITGDHTRWGYMDFESAFPLQAVSPFTEFEPHTEFTMCAGDNTGINLNCGSILYRPDYPLEDPWISIANGGHFEGYDQDLMVWGENNFGNTGSNLKNAHGGMKVLVRPRKAPLAVDRTNFSGSCPASTP